MSANQNIWAHWENKEFLRYQYLDEEAVKRLLAIQKALKDNGFLGIPWSSGSPHHWTEGLYVYPREYELELAKSWRENGELLDECADDICDNKTWNLSVDGKDHGEALIALQVVVEDFIANGPVGAQILAQEEVVNKQTHKVEEQMEILDKMEAHLRELKARKTNE